MLKSTGTMVTLARHAMATRFEIVLHGDDPRALRAAGEEALDEIERLEAQLSLFRPTSEIAHLNARASREPVRVSPPVFKLLQQAKLLHEETAGAFDITVAPLMQCWGFLGGKRRVPSEEEIQEARSRVGMHLVELNSENWTVRFLRDGVMLDLGAIGKGYAIEQAAGLLRDAGTTSGLLHGGTSTVCAIGRPPDAEAWQIAITSPGASPTHMGGIHHGTDENTHPAWTESAIVVALKNEALSVSAVWGRCFHENGQIYGHVIDPRIGRPASQAVLAAVALNSAAETDAFSTALLTVGPERHDDIACLRESMRSLVIAEEPGGFIRKSKGM